MRVDEYKQKRPWLIEQVDDAAKVDVEEEGSGMNQPFAMKRTVYRVAFLPQILFADLLETTIAPTMTTRNLVEERTEVVAIEAEVEEM